MASNGHLTAPRRQIPTTPTRGTNKNYSKDMIVDMPRENMNKNYESYLQLDRNSILLL